jgi:hypothetical protein
MANEQEQVTHIPYIPDGSQLTAFVLKKQEKQFLDILDKIMEKADESNATMRVIGSIAFRIKCPDYKYMEYENKRYLTDIDFVAYGNDIIKIQDLFFEMGWSENQNVLRLFGDKRRIFYHPHKSIHSDIFLDKLRFCHEIDFRNRLETDHPTISLTHLLLEKLQIVEINRKDLVDMMVLLSQHSVSEQGNDNKKINGNYIAKLCAKDWGWWKTVTMNIEKTHKFSEEYLEKKDALKVQKKLDTLSKLIEEHPKSIRWTIRSKIGERAKWYREVEEVDRG